MRNDTERQHVKERPQVQREAFHTSRLLDFLSEKELTAQTGHPRPAWPLVLAKELVDNSLDACEEAGIAPKVTTSVDDHGLTIIDNGPGIPPEVVAGVLDFSVRVSSREAYVAADRGAQGNALMTVVAMPYVMDGEQGRVTIRSQGVRHEITLSVDRIQQKPVVGHEQHADRRFVKNGTSVTVHLPSSIFDGDGQSLQELVEDDDDLGCSTPADLKCLFLQFADAFTFLNPHLTLSSDWRGECSTVKATNPQWAKWKPSDPTSAHWYEQEHFERLISAYLSHDAANGRNRTVREFVGEFRGLSSSGKQKKVLGGTPLHRAPLSALVNGDGRSLDSELIGNLLREMKTHSKPVKPSALGVIGKDHIATKFQANGCEMESFEYKKAVGETDGVPWIVETAFGWCPSAERRRIITGVNWSPGILNPFRELGSFGESLDTILGNQRATADEPVVLLLHLACPRVTFADRGKSTVVVEK